MTENLPDFDSMSPEQLMAWMESLAKRQGAEEGFTTNADMEIAEVDPSTVQEQGPGYIPYGMDAATWEKKQEEERRRKAERQAQKPVAAAQPAAQQPVAQPAPTPAPAQPAAAAEPAASAQPDFDSMTPEQLMAWMESLAKRQGAEEGFTTNADMQIAEVDPNTVQEQGPGYIPYGMDAATWEKKQEEERRRKAERQAQKPAAAQPQQPAAQAQPQPTAQPTPPAPTPAPAQAQPAAAQSAASAQPDFDSMTPEQLMAWMESLAKRQGAEEGFTTKADMEIAEVDPSTAQTQGPGYIPYGMDAATWEKKQEEERRRKAERQAQKPAAQTQPVAQQPTPQPPVQQPAAQAAPESVPTASDDGLSWLSSLAVDQGDNALPQLDLSGLGQPLAEPTSEDPMAWLESLSQSQGANIPGLEQFALGDDFSLPAAEPTTPAATAQPSDNALEWLESLAKRQGADEEEFMTDADLDIPLPETLPAQKTPGYKDFSFEAPELEDDGMLDFLKTDDEEEMEFETDSDQLEDPSAWLDALASGKIVETSDEVVKPPKQVDVTEALSKGADIQPDAMKDWMDNLLAQGAARHDVPDYVEEDDSEPIKAELPDWLIDQVGAPPAVPTAAAPTPPTTAPAPSFIEDIVEPPEVEMPDWLKEGITENEQFDFDSIFETGETPTPEVQAATPVASGDKRSITTELEIDPNDPWVEAFEMERKMGRLDVNKVPEWYAAKLTGQPVEQPVSGVDMLEDATLVEANLPEETELPIGQLQEVPNWLRDFEMPAAAAKPAAPAQPTAQPQPQKAAFEIVEEPAVVMEDMPDWLKESITVGEGETAGDELPDWLKESGIGQTDEVPDWLVETISTDEMPTVVPTQAAAPTFTPSAPPTAASPAPVPVPAAAINVQQTLESARSRFRAGDMDASLRDYEAIIRANAQLDAVISDLSSLTKDETHKKNPAVYRVLGDGLMRQGKLQEALDTYRRALNLL